MKRLSVLLFLLLSMVTWISPGQSSILAFERGRFDARSVQATPDGGFLLGGDLVLVKLNSSGQVSWQFQYWGNFQRDIFDFYPTSDRGYIVTGDVGYRYPDTAVIKLDAIGQVEWSRWYDAWDWFHTASIRPTPDSGYLLAGYVRWEDYSGQNPYGSRQHDVLVMKLSGIGDVLWCRKLGQSQHDEAGSHEITADGGCIIAGRTGYQYEKKRDMWLLKLSSSGSVEWQKLYGGMNREEAACVRQCSDGGFIVAGWESSFPGPDGALILKLSASGEIQWQRSLKRDGRPMHATSIAQLPDDGFVVTGGGWEEDSDLWVCKVSSQGTLEWGKLYLHDRAAGGLAVTCLGSGKILAGAWRDIPVWWTDHWLYLSQPLSFILPSSGEPSACGYWQDVEMRILETSIIPQPTTAVPEPYTITVHETQVERRDYLKSWEVLCGSSDLLPLLPPENIQAERQVNRSLFFTEHIIRLTWTENPNSQAGQLTEYRIFEEISGNFQEIGRVGSDSFSFLHRLVAFRDAIDYAVVSVDETGRMSFPATIQKK